MKLIHFYFDFLSPYAYLAWCRLPAICQKYQAKLNLHPVLFAGLLSHWGQLGPAEIPPKRDWLFKDVLRFASLHQIPMTFPKFHPFRPLMALRLALKEVSGDFQENIVKTIWHAGWVEGMDLGSSEELENILTNAGFEGKTLCEKSKNSAAKEALRHNTNEAIKQNVFGVPTIIVDNEIFWGNDQLNYLSLYLEGNDPLDQKAYQRITKNYQSASNLSRIPNQKASK